MKKVISKSCLTLITACCTLLLLSSSTLANSSPPNHSQAIPIDTSLQEKINRYGNLLSATYTKDSTALSRFSQTDRQQAEKQVGNIRDADDGFPVTKAKVTITAKSAYRDAGQDIVTADTETEIWTNTQNQPNYSNWCDSHIISFPSVDRKDGSLHVLKDYTVPEPVSKPDGQDVRKDSAFQKRTPRSPRVGGAEPIYDLDKKGIEYALKWTSGPYAGDKKEDFNPDYPFYDSGGSNCTNFVSQIIRESGQPYAGTLLGYQHDDTWIWSKLFNKASYTWGGAPNNYRYMKDHTNLFYSLPGVNPHDLTFGSLLYADWNNDGTLDHAAFISNSGGYDKNGVALNYVTQKNTNRHSMNMSRYMTIAKSQHRNVHWYGLQMKWVPTA